jgi:hypothetical protein
MDPDRKRPAPDSQWLVARALPLVRGGGRCEAAFETRTLGNLQLVLSRDLSRALPGIPAAAAAGWTGVHGILGWLTVAPLIGGALYVGLLPLLRCTARRATPAVEPGA